MRPAISVALCQECGNSSTNCVLSAYVLNKLLIYSNRNDDALFPFLHPCSPTRQHCSAFSPGLRGFWRHVTGCFLTPCPQALVSCAITSALSLGIYCLCHETLTLEEAAARNPSTTTNTHLGSYEMHFLILSKNIIIVSF